LSLNRGEEFHAEVSSADASGTVTLNYFSPGGDPITVPVGGHLLITDLNFVSAPGGAISIGAWNGSNPMFMFKGTVVANGGVSRQWNVPFMVPAGWTLKVVAPSGQVDVQVEGAIIRA
jgi:hypothetical protein